MNHDRVLAVQTQAPVRHLHRRTRPHRRSCLPLEAEALAVADVAGPRRILVANLTAEEREMRVESGRQAAKLASLAGAARVAEA
jgi:hypothetical protein